MHTDGETTQVVYLPTYNRDGVRGRFFQEEEEFATVNTIPQRQPTSSALENNSVLLACANGLMFCASGGAFA